MPFLKLQLIIDNSGMGVMDTFLSADAKKYNELLQLNVVVVTELCSLFTPSMIARRRGRIAILSSISALWPSKSL
jgi:short-subunit dehydrogenase